MPRRRPARFPPGRQSFDGTARWRARPQLSVRRRRDLLPRRPPAHKPKQRNVRA